MGKGKKPRKRRAPDVHENPDMEKEVEGQTQEQAALVPPARRPPTAVGAETPPPPPREPPRSVPAPVPERRRPTLFRLVAAIRTVVGAMLDIADAAADAITKTLEGRA